MFAPAFTLAAIYIASVYIPFIILYETLASEVAKAAENNAADDWDRLRNVKVFIDDVFLLIYQKYVLYLISKLKNIHNMLTEALELANQHVSLVSLTYLGEEVTYGVMLLRSLLVEEFPRGDLSLHAAYTALRCLGLAYVFIRLNKSVNIQNKSMLFILFIFSLI